MTGRTWLGAAAPLGPSTTAAVRAVAACVLAVPPESLPADRPLTDFGLDSVKAVELQALLRSSAALDVPLETILAGSDCAGLSACAVPAKSAGEASMVGSADEDDLTENECALYFLHHLDPDRRVYQMCHAVEITGPVTARTVNAAWTAMVHRHEALRTTFAPPDPGVPGSRMPAGRPRRIVTGPAASGRAARLEPVDCAGWTDEEVADDIAALAARPVDLEHGPVWTLRHLDRGDGRHVLALATHHIVADMWSLVLVLRELAIALAGGEVKPMAPSMRQVVRAERAYLGSARAAADLESWRERLSGAPAESRIPADRTGDVLEGALHGQGRRYRLVLGAPVADGLRTLARRARVTPYSVLLAAVFWLVHRYSGADDIVLGAPWTGRADPADHEVVGMLVNPVPVRSRVKDGEPFLTFAQRIGAAVRDELSAMRTPFPRLVQALTPPREPGRSPLFQLMVTLQQAPGDKPFAALGAGLGQVSVGELTVRGYPAPPDAQEFDLTLEAVAHDDGLVCDWRYSPARWDEDSIEEAADALRALLGQVCGNPGLTVSRIVLPVAHPDPGAAVLPGCAGPGCVDQIRVVPDDAVLRSIADDTNALSGAELASRIDDLAARLRASGVGPEDTVVLLIPRSAAFVIAALAVLRVGAAYVPVNPAHPAVQVAMRLQAARPRVICTDGQPVSLAELGDVGPVVDIASVCGAPGPRPDRVPQRQVHPDSAVYVMFTSGTTGVPKGVCVPARALSTFLDDMSRRAPLPDGAICAWWTEPTFDVSVSEIFSAVAARGHLLVVPAAVRLDPAALVRWLDERRVQAAYVPPFAIAALADHAEAAAQAGRPLALRRLLTGVEPIAHETLRRIAAAVPGLQVIFGYGPTETTIWCTYHHADASDRRRGPAPIGRPARGTSAYLLDRYLAPVPRGAAGELYIGGDYVARGYLGRPEQTAGGFMPDPFHPGARMYRTGDIARRDRHGDLFFLGRRDAQVKLNGVRVELGEVEAALGAQAGIRGAAAAVRAVNGQRVLVGYVVAGPGAATTRDLIASLRTRLSPALVPAIIVTLDHLPLTAHGKLDRAALPDPSRPAGSEPPRGQLESVIAQAWVQVLGIEDPPGRDDDFFALGGHSLLAEYIAAEIGRQLDREVPVAMLVGNPTVAELAAALEREPPRTGHIPVLPRAERDVATLTEQVRALPDALVRQLLGQEPGR